MIALDDKTLFDCLVGAGAELYSWYRRFHPYDELDKIIIEMETGEATLSGASTYAKRVVTPLMMRKAIEGLIHEQQPTICAINWADSECDSDVDADVADVVFQQIMLGEIVFG